jgi:hypothetical protein
VQIDAGDSLCTEHVTVPRVILEREANFQPASPKLVYRDALEPVDLRIVLDVSHDQEVPPDPIAREPSESLRLDAYGTSAEKHDPKARVEQLEETAYLVDQRIVTARIEESMPVAPPPFDVVLSRLCIGQHPVDVEYDRRS